MTEEERVSMKRVATTRRCSPFPKVRAEDMGLILLGLKNDYGSRWPLCTSACWVSAGPLLGQAWGTLKGPGLRATSRLRTELESGLRMGLSADFAARRDRLQLNRWPWASQLTFLEPQFLICDRVVVCAAFL